MSSEVKVTLPKLGESIVSATIVQWFKKVGDRVELDEPLLEVSTDKVNSEIPSPVAGVIKEILAEVDTEYDVGSVLAVVETKAAAAQGGEKPQKATPQTVVTSSQENKDFFTPAILRLSREQGISFEQLQKIKGTGEGGRITKKDLEAFAEGRKAPCPAAAVVSAEETERVKMSGLRKAIAENMVRSFYEAPHATLVHEVDVTQCMDYIQKEKESFLAQHGVKLTITSFIIRAISQAVLHYPIINSSLEDDTIVVKRNINIGIAVSIDQGVIVPVIKNCQRMDLPIIARHVHELSTKARSGSLTPGDTKEGTITMTNFGMTGITFGIPIIRFPEVAIIGIGAVQKKVVAFDDGSFGVRSIMHVSLTFDHRVLDGMYGCGFLAALKSNLESP
jgi:2-oxoglutarate dehydrogenase E2 component (dihydrolipoamide succinyltransferase)